MASTLTTKAETPTGGKKSSWFLKLFLMVALLGGIGGLAYYKGVDEAQVRAPLTRLNAEAHAATTAHAAESSTEDLGELHSAKPWDGMVTVSPHELKAVGINFAKVVAQTKPIKLELNGRTDHDPNTISAFVPASIRALSACSPRSAKRSRRAIRWSCSIAPIWRPPRAIFR